MYSKSQIKPTASYLLHTQNIQRYFLCHEYICGTNQPNGLTHHQSYPDRDGRVRVSVLLHRLRGLKHPGMLNAPNRAFFHILLPDIEHHGVTGWHDRKTLHMHLSAVLPDGHIEFHCRIKKQKIRFYRKV